MGGPQVLMGLYGVGDFPLAGANASSQGKAPRHRAGAQAQADAGMQLVLGRQVEARGFCGMVAQVGVEQVLGVRAEDQYKIDPGGAKRAGTVVPESQFQVGRDFQSEAQALGAIPLGPLFLLQVEDGNGGSQFQVGAQRKAASQALRSR